MPLSVGPNGPVELPEGQQELNYACPMTCLGQMSTAARAARLVQSLPSPLAPP